MSLSERRAAELRVLLEGPYPRVPPDLAATAAGRGARMLRRRAALRRTGWSLLWMAAVAFAVWAVLTRPWEVQPGSVAPPLEGW
ncbi:hypothetical protein ACN20G_08310 [Streptomyces sp. BI20]|uniref:hypothetical protein n=1 Tax=Streptomyces sp. BI20 TaxID=3403460 RepID=UPI003C72BC18